MKTTSKFIVFIALVSNVAIAGTLKLSGAAPPGMVSLETDIDAHPPKSINLGSHGMESFCYKTNVFVIYEQNLLGNGYQLLSNEPQELSCITPGITISSQNKLGISLSMSKSEVEELLGLTTFDDDQTIIWLDNVDLENGRYDIQTYAEFQFEQNALAKLVVFTTTTN